MKSLRSIGIVGTIAGLAITAFGWYNYSSAVDYIRALNSIWIGDRPTSSIALWEAEASNYRVVLIVGAIVLLIGVILLVASFMNNKANGTGTEKATSVIQSTNEKMVELKQMLNGGLISHEEYEQKRKDILDKM